MKKLLLPLAATVLVAGAAHAQRPIYPGELTRGALSFNDPQLPDDTYYDEYAFTGRRGETVVVSMNSDAIDTYLYIGTLRYGRYQELARDDDGGGGTNSRVELRLPEDGQYVIRASSLAEQTGPYTLSLVGGRGGASTGGWDEPRRPQPARPDLPPPVSGRSGDRILPGRPVEGRLTATDPKLDNGSNFHNYHYAGRRGERLSVTLRSLDFDAYLVLGTPGGRHGIQNALIRDDDGAGDRNARIDFTLPMDGEYVIRVSPVLLGTGRYTLEMRSSFEGNWPGAEPQRPDGYGYDGEEVDARLVGEWGLVRPSVTVNPDSWASVAANAGVGYLTIEDDGRYEWNRSGRVTRGSLEPVAPPRGADPTARYYAIDDGRGDYYLSITRRRGREVMQLFDRANDGLIAYGYRDPRAR